MRNPGVSVQAEEIALTELYAVVTQDQIDRRHMEIEIRQGETDQVVLAAEYELLHACRHAHLALFGAGKGRVVDDLMEQLFRELLSFMVENPHTISRAIRLSFIAKSLERMADHATNIAELVVYLVEGKIIRHTSPPVPL